mmetsp:Transcript_48465/g.94727  ORF Transcript_48465/g.94727 Transcript_48465/m.94727 type:complete len:461 (-) Transcript_48465:1698-3080(-)|eukprot:CAMPEP_0194348588 /NCGR_PEP_ID=MMETSP0171-20130528/106616_1 /TAXON_ID=218684 /ORGANISM="Corethron pennatum, Strain L29A3" /LENGTH=460 /DNA_ID=CAMNT_0039115943 /DNA_START=120 /DNA_END=1505 /DNA_ORIENTATION=-
MSARHVPLLRVPPRCVLLLQLLLLSNCAGLYHCKHTQARSSSRDAAFGFRRPKARESNGTLFIEVNDDNNDRYNESLKSSLNVLHTDSNNTIFQKTGNATFFDELLDAAGTEKALCELKERASFTAKMELTNTVANKLVKLTNTSARRKGNARAVAKRLSRTGRNGSKLSKRIMTPFRKLRRDYSRTVFGFWKKPNNASVLRRSAVHRARTSATANVSTRAAARAATTHVKTTTGKAVAQKLAAATATGKSAVAGSTRTWIRRTAATTCRTPGVAASTVATVARQGTAARATAGAGRRSLAVSSAAGRRLAWRRAGRCLTLALPVIGGAFAWLAFRVDYRRWQEEQRHDGRRSSSPQQPRGSTVSGIASAACVLFAVAAAADCVDTLCHVVIASALFLRQFFAHKYATTAAANLLTAESISMVCAIVSTVCAVVGELLSSEQGKEEETSEFTTSNCLPAS